MRILNWYLEHKKEILQTFVVFLICLSSVFIFTSTKLSEDNYNYAVEEMHAYNDDLFQNNINIVGHDYSPRLYANLFMAGMMRIWGINWYTASMILICINYILYALAITLFVKDIFQSNNILSGILLVVCCMSGALISLAFGFNGAPDVFLGTAIPLAMIAITLVISEKRNWKLAWIFVSIAEFMHVHEGIWAGCILGMIWFSDCLVSKKFQWRALKMIPLYILSVFLVVFPSLMNTKKVDDALFNEIYVFIRTPHHLLVSSWGVGKIALSGIMLFGAFYILLSEYKKAKSNNLNTSDLKRNLTGYSFLLILWVVLLAIQYCSTEVFSSSAIVTMYVPKCLKYITWIAVLIYAKYGMEYLEQKKFIQGFSLIGILLFPYSRWKIVHGCMIYSILFLAYYFFEKYELDKRIFVKRENDDTLHILFWIVISAALWHRIVLLAGQSKRRSSILILGTAIFICFIKNRIKIKKLAKIMMIIGLAVSVLGSFKGFIYYIDQNKIYLVSGEDYVKNAVGREVYELAKAFQNLTDTDDMFLADPDSSQSNGFQLVSQRSCYALYKNTPSSKSVVIEWYQKIENVRKMTSCPADELWDLMKKIGVSYVLVTENRFEELENSGLFDITVKNETMGVYKAICVEENGNTW